MIGWALGSLQFSLISVNGFIQNHAPEVFFWLVHLQCSIPDDKLYHLSQLKFDGKDGTSITKHISDFLKFCESYEIDDEEFAYVVFSLTLEGHVNKWCHMFLESSIHLFELINKLWWVFHKHDFQDVLMRINELRMKLEESLEDFILIFVHICFEIPKRGTDWVYLSENFQWLVIVSFQHLQFRMNLDSHEYHDNLQTTNHLVSSL